MPKKQTAPVHLDWRKGDVVDVGLIKKLTIIGVFHDDRCAVFCLEATDGTRYRYAHSLKLFRLN